MIIVAVVGVGTRHVVHEDEVDIEFDDGDSGRMPISLLRFLPHNYPVTGEILQPGPIIHRVRVRWRSIKPRPVDSRRFPSDAGLEPSAKRPEPEPEWSSLESSDAGLDFQCGGNPIE